MPAADRQIEVADRFRCPSDSRLQQSAIHLDQIGRCGVQHLRLVQQCRSILPDLPARTSDTPGSAELAHVTGFRQGSPAEAAPGPFAPRRKREMDDLDLPRVAPVATSGGQPRRVRSWSRQIQRNPASPTQRHHGLQDDRCQAHLLAAHSDRAPPAYWLRPRPISGLRALTVSSAPLSTSPARKRPARTGAAKLVPLQVAESGNKGVRVNRASAATQWPFQEGVLSPRTLSGGRCRRNQVGTRSFGVDPRTIVRKQRHCRVGVERCNTGHRHASAVGELQVVSECCWITPSHRRVISGRTENRRSLGSEFEHQLSQARRVGDVVPGLRVIAQRQHQRIESDLAPGLR